MSTETYEGPVAYQDGWHYAVDAICTTLTLRLIGRVGIKSGRHGG